MDNVVKFTISTTIKVRPLVANQKMRGGKTALVPGFKESENANCEIGYRALKMGCADSAEMPESG
jgi:hypothetical protein